MEGPQELRVHRFHPDGLDPITVFAEQWKPGSSRLTIVCYAQAWTTWWGSHGECQVEEFINKCDADYIANSLKWGTNGLILKRLEKDNHAYLVRIVEAVQSHFRQPGAKP